ncbi:Gfo/Idh/MocA family oxidoreductase [uncultured Alistipes sp.]|jgi:predicted dehydrogenases and related proteins|uniref:Gfo/Idh/MocA family protein n=1 Tax=uncultured Alistipes sp. TaxID=538949 RepID=UPI0025ED393C|nr:Gfo/Idh/MocA family oxidoreductase [uncultured Alistipes sp.]
MKNRSSVSRPVRIVVIGAGNRANKYLEYARRHPDRLSLVGVVEINDLRRRAMAQTFGIPEKRCYSDYDVFFADKVEADMVLISTPENIHFDPAVKAIDAGYHVLLEKPISQHLGQCREIAQRARERGILVGVCHVLRFHPYFAKIRELVTSGEFGQIVSIDHTASVGLDRATHSYVRGAFRREKEANPILLAKCCHDIDFLLWLTDARCRKLSSFGSLRWFRAENAPAGSGERCMDCAIEPQCPFSARDLYYVRKDWVANFDVVPGSTLDQTILEELRTGQYGRCVYRCDNDVVDHQLLAMEMSDRMTISLSMEMFTGDDFRKTHIRLTGGEIDGDEHTLRVRKFRGRYERVYDFSELVGQPFHAGADLMLIEDFIRAVSDPGYPLLTSIDDAIESHRICYEAERSRRTGQTIYLDEGN